MSTKVENSHSSSESVASQKSSRGSSGGRSYKREKKELNCLERFWEAVKNFFASLCCCCCCCESKKNDPSSHAPTSSRQSASSQKRGPKTPQDSASEDSTATAEEPNKQGSVKTSSGPANKTQTQQTATPVTPQDKPKEIAKKPKKKASEGAKIPLYIPLQALMEQRQRKIAYAPTFPKREAKPLNKPADFPYLDELKKTLGEPKLPMLRAAQQQFRENAIKDLTGYVKQLIDGWCPCLSQAKDPEKAMQHPAQLELIFTFCKERIGKLNLLLEQAKQPKIDEADFLKQFDELQKVTGLWHSLWEIAQKPDLNEADCELLAQCSRDLPDAASAFDQEYPEIGTHFISLALSISSKLVVAGNLAHLNATAEALTKKLGIKFSFKVPNALLHAHKELFITTLVNGITALFQKQQEQTEGEALAFEIEHIEQISDYLIEEVERYNEAIAQLKEQYPDLKMEIQEADPEALSQSTLGNIKPLVEAWRRMKHMLDAGTGIDAKIEDLKKIAEILPEKEADSWKKYPRFKEAMGKELLPLLFKDFSGYQFECVKNKYNGSKLEADQKRKTEITTAFETMAAKLGCDKKDFKLPEIIMATEDDELLQQQNAAEEIENRAAALYAIYLNNIELGEDFAVSQVAERIKADGQQASIDAILAVMADQAVARKIRAKFLHL